MPHLEVDAADRFFDTRAVPEGVFDDTTHAALVLAAAMSPSPAAVDAAVIELARRSLAPAQIVELAVWISVSQLLHRLTVWFGRSDPQ